MLIDDFHFLRPWWLLACVPLVNLAWLWIRRTQRGSGWESAIDDNLLDVLLDASHIKTSRLLGISLITALLIACLGLAGPTWQKLPQNVEMKNDALIIVLDLSLSMLAQDVKPSRIERARQKVTDVLRLREEGQTALVVYGGDAHAVVPLTDDVATIENLLPSLSPEMMPVYGSNPNHALILARELFENNRMAQGRILLITDGIDDLSTVSRHRDRAFPISILGIGTESGAEIPLDRLQQPGRSLRTQEGNQVIAILDQSRLRDAAALTYGNYQRVQLGDADIYRLLSTKLPSEDESIEVEREFDTWFDQGYWATLVLIPLALMLFRKGLMICVVAVVCVPSPPAQASSPAAVPTAEMTTGIADAWQSLWQRADQRALEKLRHGEPEKAAALFRDPQWQSVAQYRSGDYGAALQGFKFDPSLTGHYNQANSLARLGEYEPAIREYEEVLSADPGHDDAAFNKALVERLLEEKQDAEQQQNQEQQNQANNENSDANQDDQQESQDQSDQQDDEDSQEQKDKQSEQEQDSEQSSDQQQNAQTEQDQQSRDEQQDALEQWLRRVPDDPGGLLRRKFSHETKQRLRRGEYENRQGDKLW